MKKTIINIISNGLYQVFILFIPFITIPYVSRTIGVDGLGIFSKIFSFVVFITVISLFGLNQLGSREISKASFEKRGKRFSELYSLQWMFGTLVLLAYLFYVFVFLKGSNEQIYYILQLPLVLAYAIDISWFYVGIGEMQKVVMRNTMVKISVLVLIFLLVHDPKDLWLYVMLNGASTFLANIVLWLQVKKELPYLKFIVSFKYLKDGFTLLIPELSNAVVLQLATTLVATVGTVADASFYDQSQKLARIVLGLLSSANIVLMPVIAKMHEEGNKEQINKILKLSIKALMVLSFLFTTILFVNAKTFIPWFFGNDFKAMTINFEISALILLFIPIYKQFDSQVLIARGHYKQYSIGVSGIAVFNILMIIALTKFYGSVGASLAMLITEGLGLIVRLALTRKLVPLKTLLNPLPYIFSGFVITTVVSMFVRNLFNFPAFMTLVMMSILQAIFFLGFVLARKEDRELGKVVMKKIMSRFG